MSDDPPTVLLGRVGHDPPRWPTVDPDDLQPPPPAPVTEGLLLRVLDGLRRL